MNFAHRYSALLLASLVSVTGCDRQEHGAPLFRLLSPDQTGVTFVNTITTSDAVNVQTDAFVYNGGGVAIGDIDNDGLPDIFLTGNMVSSRLYVNKGDLRFEDITESAGVATDTWANGASMVDIDNDGYLDIYVSVSGPKWSTPEERTNLLFLNNGDRTFTEAAAAYGIDDTGFSTHAVFFDYDLNGHLDLFLLTNDPAGFARGEAERHPSGMRSESPTSYDRFYRNNGDGTFADISEDAGIVREVGFGLGVVVADLNGDGWPDIYVSNDDTPSDVLYVNNRNGTFTDKAATWLKHTSFAGMGIDIADFNNDGWLDVIQMDMVPEDLQARKRSTGAMTYSSIMELRRRGFHQGYSANTLQLNNGVIRGSDASFSDIAQMAGVAHTNWSWSALFGDYDNDGYKDIFIANGYPKAVIDFDYQVRMYAVRRAGNDQRALEMLDELHSYDVSNYVFRNEGDLTFSNKTNAWGMHHPGFSYGAAYADLDGDGSLDFVINNIDAPASIYHNVRPTGDTNHYLQITLAGESPNRRGLGSKLTLRAGGQRQYIDHSPYRGYQSSMDDRIHFGLGDAQRVDSLEVVWPDGRYQVLTDLQVDRVLTVRQRDAAEKKGPNTSAPADHRMFQPMDPGKGLKYMHREKAFVDYSVQPLLPHMLSRQGPPLAVGDVTGNGLDDVFIGGAAGFPGTLFMQREDGSFVETTHRQPWAADKDYDDWGALFFDADGNGLLDLYVASGGYHLSPVSGLLQDRLYMNQGGGRFVRDTAALPQMLTSTASVTAGDFTGDGQLDLFVGGRLVPRNYPYPTRSYVLRNDGGRFTDITEMAGPELVQPGAMITDAVWMDFTADGRLDLVTAGDWMPVEFYENDGERLRRITGSVGLPPMLGWWYSLDAGDFNNDGRPDLVAGNLGLNYTFTTSPKSRFGVYAYDFTGNLTTDIVLTQEIDGTEYPFFGFATLGREIYTVGLKFSTYESFAKAPIRNVFNPSELKEAVHYQADTFASVYLQNDGDGTFTLVPLPNFAQLSPIRSIIAHDVDGDGNLDLIVAGNLYYSEPNTPRADAGNGVWLRGDGHGAFTPVPPRTSGFLAPLEVTDLALITMPTGKAVLVANNGDSLQGFTIRGR
ncbi:MAG: VCBS repeat-containing protein [Gemmatimonadota bacterium]|nr:VCBS repeat-containing protein [Gemmatimonadota bacterium]MDH3367399.1 VCBS repeat-containing protein [Gemmatimonadota bacterium]MDH3477754.1 VCBS repeat-containing protein [Gemmatimonadota bacterium]MDH3570114.1 VCBS repeat-containing protein [Gemmatimonadota bacterium]MDH5548522.1 VCBS repeat-containing protein [Gemmatimonadota bacterium]